MSDYPNPEKLDDTAAHSAPEDDTPAPAPERDDGDVENGGGA